MSYFLLIFLMILSAFSAPNNLQKIQIKNLDLDYVYPQGSGTLEKLAVGISIVEDEKQIYPVEVYRRESSFDVLTPFIDFQWLDPVAYLHNLEKGSTQKFNLMIDKREHFLKGESLKFTPPKAAEFSFKDFSLVCQGASQDPDVIKRLKADCLQEMRATVSHLDLPFQLLKDIADQLPEAPAETDDIPANDFSFTMNEGEFYSRVRIKYLIRATLRLWGEAHFENEGKTLAIRVDQIKYGILPVTSIVMSELQRQIRHPRIIINPPWIRINQP